MVVSEILQEDEKKIWHPVINPTPRDMSSSQRGPTRSRTVQREVYTSSFKETPPAYAPQSRGLRVPMSCVYACTCSWFLLTVAFASLFAWSYTEMQSKPSHDDVMAKLHSTYTVMEPIGAVGRAVNTIMMSDITVAVYEDVADTNSSWSTDTSLGEIIQDVAGEFVDCIEGLDESLSTIQANNYSFSQAWQSVAMCNTTWTTVDTLWTTISAPFLANEDQVEDFLNNLNVL